MSISNEIQKLQTNLTNSYEACNDKGATMPASQNFDNLADCIDSISTENVLKPYVGVFGQRAYLSNNTFIQTCDTRTDDSISTNSLVTIKPGLTGTHFLLENNSDDEISYQWKWFPLGQKYTGDRSILALYFLDENYSLCRIILDTFNGYFRFITDTTGSQVVSSTSFAWDFSIEYKFKLTIKRNSVTWEVSTDDGETYTQLISSNYPTSKFYMLVSIDLFNGNTYYIPACMDITQMKLMYKDETYDILEVKNGATYNYLDNGKLPIINSNGYLTGFKDHTTQSCYPAISCPDFASANTFEICLKFWGANGHGSLLCGTPNHQVISMWVGSNKTHALIGNSTGTGWQSSVLTGSADINNETWYWYKIEFTGTKYIGSVSNDGETFTQDWEYTSSTKVAYFNEYCNIGLNENEESAFKGVIDLNECYIKIDGETVWKGVN